MYSYIISSLSIYNCKVSKDLLINSSASSSELVFLRLPALCSILSNSFLFFIFIFLFCAQSFRFVLFCSGLFPFVLDLHAILMPTEFSPIFREFLEILLDLQKSVFVSFLFASIFVRCHSSGIRPVLQHLADASCFKFRPHT
jgi:hypothetical protein